ncbi:MAG: PIN domain nuclease [Acidimicrobiaceae bacterium]|nr:PIN domain nuclease [Acidimicrobiaceae bacterium]
MARRTLPDSAMTGLTLDTGALIALERGNRVVAAVLQRAIAANADVALPTTVIAQAMRDPAKQVALNVLMRTSATDIVDLDQPNAVAVGRMLAVSGTSDITDAHVAVTATSRNHTIATNDPGDLAALAPNCKLIQV